MNKTSQYIFGLYQFLLNLRDTLEYTINRDHDVRVYNERKRIIVNNIEDQNSVFGNFIANNKEQTEKLVESLKAFVEDFYSDSSTILVVAGEKIRVDYTQNIKTFESTINLAESIRDILYAHINHAMSVKELDENLLNLIKRDEKLYRSIVNMLVMQEFQKSFAEFQKAMGESHGQPTPQSNFIVQNELVKLSGLLRFSRQHAHCTDNETLDMLDRTNAVLEMTEGRRDRRDNKSFKELFDVVNKEALEAVRVNELAWREQYDVVIKNVIATQSENAVKA